ncbi:SCO family protein [Wenzhouxiangella sp. AB-CW3]|uniref:SCO family protein n=1 Tax=Wenzhouxiangella sp. AB-CW3 TaxID=2771012 RepID=UPI00168AEF27|nr:SCO family protein [Wenzhouxiangella sp. AB-CW3]QOC22494.1 SCO family protein [Wenzhouxiangella sp. AB-CW3]
MTTRRRLLIPFLLLVMAGSLLAGIWLSQQPTGRTAWGSAPPEVQAVMWPEPRSLAEFQLHTQHGRPFGRDQFKGYWSFVFYGYMACPDVCPMSLHALRGMHDFLEAQGAADNLQVLFVSLDPDNDSPAEMQEYLDWYHEDFIGLHGELEQIDRLAAPMAIKYAEHVDETGYRSIDHTSSVMIVDPRGRVVGALSPPLEPQRMAEQFQRLRGHFERNRI